jgi:hypothetical protein
MSDNHYRLFKAVLIVITLLGAALYFRYGYLSPHYGFDRLTGGVQTVTPDGTWTRETLGEPKNQ